jgi:K+-transporting ATPase ATPase B chain
MMTSGNLATAQPSVPSPVPLERPPRRSRREGLLAPELVRAALKQSFIMLRPDIQWKNPVMFVVEVGAFLTLLFTVQGIVAGSSSQVPLNYFIALDVWLFLTVLFANFATALAEARGKAQAESLRRTRRDTPARRLAPNGAIEEISSAALRMGDRVVVETGQVIPGDGEIIEGIASVDESSITGESAPGHPRSRW